MKLYALIFVAAGSLAGASAADPLPLLPDRPFQAVILPAESIRGQRALTNYFSDFWTPTLAEVTRAEKCMTDFFAADAAKKSPSRFAQTVIADIREHPEKFIHQYFGARRSGELVIVCNALPVNTMKELLGSWREMYVGVADVAGSWHIEYSPAKDKISWFFIDQGY